MIDGLSRLGAFIKVVMPVSLAGILTVVIFAFTLVTQEFVYGLTFITSSASYTVSVGVPTFLVRGDVYLGFHDGCMPHRERAHRCHLQPVRRPVRRGLHGWSCQIEGGGKGPEPNRSESVILGDCQHDPQAEIRNLPALFPQEGSAHGQAEEPRHVQKPRSRRET
jgi:hypothetical protein